MVDRETDITVIDWEGVKEVARETDITVIDWEG